MTIAIVIGFLLDLWLGDPQWLKWHPVRLLGRQIGASEKYFRKLSHNDRINGIIFALTIAVFWPGLAWLALKLLFAMNAALGTAVAALLFYFVISIKDLKAHVESVSRALKNSDIELARKELSKVVGRDTGDLDKGDIARAAVETTAESTVDGIIAPIFFAFLGGIPLAWMYKAINTLDSMVGYRNEKYRDFGWASARMDHFLNIIPSMLSSAVVAIAAFILRKNWREAFRPSRRLDTSIIQAGFAGALGIEIGGVNHYQGQAIEKPVFGKGNSAPDIIHISESIKLSYACAMITLVSGVLLNV
ncbi:MAG: adenosylcobinamide-phosphate synthase CbiB [Candidatus Omnitrophica bacterium]|nr:adenosylcobinamide-phosphate synthase CbiB [Candidatus Omnitrophota bacterium]